MAAEQGRKRATRAASERPSDVPANNLAAQLTSFVGRERDVAQIQALLETNRLVTITGAGGIGKTRVALEVSSRIAGMGIDGLWFVDLAPVLDGSHPHGRGRAWMIFRRRQPMKTTTSLGDSGRPKPGSWLGDRSPAGPRKTRSLLAK